MTTEMIQMKDLIKKLGITMTAKRVSKNPNAPKDTWEANARHFLTILKMGNRKMRVYFSQGSAHTENPTAEDVLDCLALDASGFENARSFEEWASEYGYDTDSRRALAVYGSVESQTERLKAFMGSDYEDLLWNTERA